jgi:hypothetical protein
MDFLDIFMPCPVQSSVRAKAFLWLAYHYLEGQTDNPFDDQYSLAHPGKSPYLYRVDPAAVADENRDTLAEITWGQKMAAKRAQFMDEQLRAGDDVSQSYRPYLQAGTGSTREPEDRSRFPTAPGKMAQQQQAPPASHLAREMSLHAGMDLSSTLPFRLLISLQWVRHRSLVASHSPMLEGSRCFNVSTDPQRFYEPADRSRYLAQRATP